LTVLLHGRDLRRVRGGGAELVQRLYLAVRDVTWATIEPALADYETSDGGDRFRVRYQARFVQGELDFSAWVTFEGSQDGTIRCEMDGRANNDFQYNRIGFCVLHPPSSFGRPYRASSPEQQAEGTLPSLVHPQLQRDGELLAIFPPYQHLEIALAGGITLCFDFEGDLFEMEDQRNWTDTSFKTYSTPLTLGFPHHAKRGQAIRQRVEISATGLPAGASDEAGPLQIRLGPTVRPGLPLLGFGTSSVVTDLSHRQVELLRRASPDHIRTDAHLDDPSLSEVIEATVHAASRLRTGLELAISLSANYKGELDRLAPLVRGLPIRRFLIFWEGSPVSDGALVQAVKQRLLPDHPRAQYIGGTNLYFADLNRNRPDVTGMDAVVFSINPQLHSSDELSLTENLQAQSDAVHTASAVSDGLPVVVSPVTLKPRFNPFATEEEASDPTAPPSPVDPRQPSLFGAVWTLGSLKYLTESGAASVTYYETVGWKGLIEREEGSQLPAAFASQPGMVFPLYWVFADLAGWRDAEVLSCESSNPLAIVGLALRKEGRTRILLGNLTMSQQRVLVEAGSEMTVRYLDHRSFQAAASGDANSRRTEEAEGHLELGPYAMACIDLKGGRHA